MAEGDVVSKDDTKTAIEDAKSREGQALLDEKNRAIIDAAREQMKAAMSGGLQLADEAIPLEEAFKEIQKEMKRRFSHRLNSNEQDKHLATLYQTKRIYETFEVGPGDFTVRMQSINSDEDMFITQVTLLNSMALRTGAEDVPRHDNAKRQELLLAFLVVAVGDHVMNPISIEDLYGDIEKQGTEEAKMVTVNEKMTEINRRVGDIRKRLPFGMYPTVVTAAWTWIQYLQDLVSPERIANFSIPPSEHS